MATCQSTVSTGFRRSGQNVAIKDLSQKRAYHWLPPDDVILPSSVNIGKIAITPFKGYKPLHANCLQNFKSQLSFGDVVGVVGVKF